MIELDDDVLHFRFPEVHPKAGCRIDFQRTLRLPDDNRAYALPPGLGRFPLAHVDDHADRLPETWRRHGGVFLSIYQAEALWLHFDGGYPCAIKIAAGKINAVSGAPWSNGLSAKPQDYVVSSEQPWLDGFNVAEGLIRQFVAMPLGEGFTAEEQLTGAAEHGGLQIVVYPMKGERYAELFERPIVEEKSSYAGPRVMFSRARAPEMGLAPGGLMRQEIYEDEYGLDAWDLEHGARCFVHLANSAQYHAITGRQPPHKPPTAREYTQAGLPWFDYYSDGKVLPGSGVLGRLASIAAKVIGKGQGPLADNEPVEPAVVKLGKKGMVREGEF
jgi:hypothetical protein